VQLHHARGDREPDALAAFRVVAALVGSIERLKDASEIVGRNSGPAVEHMDGGVAEGSVFRWKSGAATITSTLEHVEAPRRVAWSGKAFGLNAIHVYALEARDGLTLVHTEESYDGLVARVFRSRLQKTLDDALEGGLQHLKVEAERRTAHLGERRS